MCKSTHLNLIISEDFILTQSEKKTYTYKKANISIDTILDTGGGTILDTRGGRYYIRHGGRYYIRQGGGGTILDTGEVLY